MQQEEQNNPKAAGMFTGNQKPKPQAQLSGF